jgi:hypothetical protein
VCYISRVDADARDLFGITARMYYDDHPPPHFHAYWNRAEHHEALQPIEPLQ